MPGSGRTGNTADTRRAISCPPRTDSNGRGFSDRTRRTGSPRPVPVWAGPSCPRPAATTRKRHRRRKTSRGRTAAEATTTTTVPAATRSHRRDGGGDGGAAAGDCDCGVRRATSPNLGRRHVPACTGRPAAGRRGSRRVP